MGIPGLYKELGPGKRISLAKLSVEHLEATERPFRLAIDISIWQFQIQSGEGGQNPALRTLYYRLIKLLALGVRPLFVFDGPYKPKLKRNVKSHFTTASLDNYLTKQLLTKFKFPFHDAPGEAEAECALLQREGLVDAVLSEDVDTMMFGCTLSLRSWTSEGQRSGKSPTHVNVYTAEANDRDAGLNSHGMILIALMSGGDYNTEGVKGCGPKIACEAARAGFGRELCQLAKNDHTGLAEWRTRLQHELHTNESKLFKQKNKSINLPGDFPDPKVLQYYTHPVVSSSEKIGRLKESIRWDMAIDSTELRAFVAEAFNWTYLIGAKFFIRTCAPALLVHKLLERSMKQSSNDDDCDDLEVKASAESQMIKAVHGKRADWSTDGCQELRVSYVPSDIVGLPLDLEEDPEQSENVDVAHEDDEGSSDGESKKIVGSPSKRKRPSAYDPCQPAKVWLLETFVKLGTPLLVETWEVDMRDPKKFAARKARERAALTKSQQNTRNKTLDCFVKVTKLIPEQQRLRDVEVIKSSAPPSSMSLITAASIPAVKKVQHSRSTKTKDLDTSTIAAPSDTIINPWTLSKRPPDTYEFRSPVRYSALGIYAPDDAESLEPRSQGDCRSSHSTQLSENPDSPAKPDALTPRTKRNREVSTVLSSGSNAHIQRLDNITYRTPRRLETTKASPSKRKTTVKTGGRRNPKIPQRELTTLPEGAELVNLDSEIEEEIERRPITPRVNRKLEFERSTTLRPNDPPESPAMDDSSLTSLPELHSIKECAKTSISSTKVTSQNIQSLQPVKASRGHHNLIRLRESLEGAWNHVEPWEVGSATDVFTSVEVLDLTSNG